MKLLKVKLHATKSSYVVYECFVEAPDDAEPDDLIDSLNEAVDGSEFEEEAGDWHSEGEEWSVVEETADQELPRWRYVPGEKGSIEPVSTAGENAIEGCDRSATS